MNTANVPDDVLVARFYTRIKDTVTDPYYLEVVYPKLAVLIGYHPLRWPPTRKRLHQALTAWVAGTGSSSKSFCYSEPGAVRQEMVHCARHLK